MLKRNNKISTIIYLFIFLKYCGWEYYDYSVETDNFGSYCKRIILYLISKNELQIMQA